MVTQAVVSTPSGAPAVVTASNGSDAAVIQALLAGMQPAQQQAVQAQLAVQAAMRGNQAYVRSSMEKHAAALTNGITTQAYALASPFTFNLPQPNNSYTKGIIIRVNLNYTLGAGASAAYAPTANGLLGIIDTFEVKYNKSQIKMRPRHLRDLAMLGALEVPVYPDAVQYGRQSDATIQSFLSNNPIPTSVGAQSCVLQFYVPFNILSPRETRGLLPSMPGETGIQVVVNTPQSLLSPDPMQGAIYETSGTGGSITAVSGTIEVISVYLDGDNYNSTQKLPYDMTVLNGTIQMQIDTQIQNLIAGQVMRNKLNIVGQHQYVLLYIIDGQQSNQFCTTNNINYIESSQDDVGANVFFRYGQQTNLSVLDWLAILRHRHYGDLDEGVIPLVEAPLVGQSSFGARDGNAFLDNSTNGWPAWHYGVMLGAISTANGITPRFELFTCFVNPTPLTPV